MKLNALGAAIAFTLFALGAKAADYHQVKDPRDVDELLSRSESLGEIVAFKYLCLAEQDKELAAAYGTYLGLLTSDGYILTRAKRAFVTGASRTPKCDDPGAQLSSIAGSGGILAGMKNFAETGAWIRE
ncbi:hypothetical protein [Rhizobium leguminosarum]|uniref:hypothetical protein n=1 Tax=Rhizobium leguminosarum TaxID=384 RepID=UPI001030F23F|nr:hypothetical protein [Rhizobium leguminosarum]TAV89305.1 hypothetical protein ELI22_08815 [Rhizobium leguminosarum]TAV93886.1 hypothetical protein ELI21_08805 [Rhizobium leguminosarum]TAW34963.1 hypothetical protein ELI23_08845 [Rhizobium leguminosarum]